MPERASPKIAAALDNDRHAHRLPRRIETPDPSETLPTSWGYGSESWKVFCKFLWVERGQFLQRCVGALAGSLIQDFALKG